MSKARPRRREPASVTIGNLELQLRNATQRCNDLIAARDSYQRIAGEREQKIAELNRELAAERSNNFATGSMLQEAQAKLASTEQRFEGYRMHVADTLRPPVLPSQAQERRPSMRDLLSRSDQYRA